MSKDSSEQQWTRLAQAARNSKRPQPPDTVPDNEEIRARFKGMIGMIREMSLLHLWKRWALLAVLLGILTYVTVFIAVSWHKTTAPDPPTISIPLPP
jgi:hypothetical protein